MHDIVKNASLKEAGVLEQPRDLSPDDGGRAMHDFISELYPICRSITGDGVRKTIGIIRAYIPADHL